MGSGHVRRLGLARRRAAAILEHGHLALLVVLLRDEVGRGLLEDYYREHAQVAADHGTGFVFETPTWRSSSD